MDEKSKSMYEGVFMCTCVGVHVCVCACMSVVYKLHFLQVFGWNIRGDAGD